MNKRVFILVSTILCALVTISLVTYTIVGMFQTNTVAPAPENKPTTEVGVGSGELTSENLTLNFIVGDEYDGEVLTAENYTGTLLTQGEGGKLVATQAGTERVSVINGSVAYACVITVYEKGDGSAENPFSIIRAEDLIDLVNESCVTGEYYHYSQRCDIDLSTYESWVPLGKLTTPFMGSYDGNNHVIKNMNINVTKDNIESYMDSAQTGGGATGSMLTVGFFGFVGDPLGESRSEIKNISVIDANISTVEIDAKSGAYGVESAEYRDSLVLTQAYVGVLAGYVVNTDVYGNSVSSVSSTIYSSIYCDKTTSTKSGISGFIGGASTSSISGYEVVADITSRNAGTVEDTGNGYKFYGTTIAGILARNYNTNVSDMVVELEVAAKNYENTVIAGAIAYVEKPSSETHIEIKNIQVNDLYISVTSASYVSDKTAIIAGAVSANYNVNCIIENVNVSDIVVYASTTGQISGLININDGIIKNSIVTGYMKGVEVAGFVNANYGTIIWDDSITDSAIDVKLVGKVKVGGVAIFNFGKIEGAQNLTQVKASIGWNTVTSAFESIRQEAMMAGVAVVNAGTNAVIKNLYTLSYMGPSTRSSGGGVVNAGGVVGIFGAYTTAGGKTHVGGELENIIVNSSIQTIAGKIGDNIYSGKTNVVGGIVAIVGETNANLIIRNVSGNITVNNNMDGVFGLEVYGTIVGVNKASSLKISSDDATQVLYSTVFTNYSGSGSQYIGYLIGKNHSSAPTIEEKVLVRISIIETAEGAMVGRIN